MYLVGDLVGKTFPVRTKGIQGGSKLWIFKYKLQLRARTKKILWLK